VLKATVGGYKISISGLSRSTSIYPDRPVYPYLPYIDVEVTDDTVAVSDMIRLSVILSNKAVPYSEYRHIRLSFVHPALA